MLAETRSTIVIPVCSRDGQIDRKPLAVAGGKTLLRWTVESAQKVDCDEVVVVSDCEEIAHSVEGLCDVLVDDDPRCWCGIARAGVAAKRCATLFPVATEPRYSVVVLPVSVPIISAALLERMMVRIFAERDPGFVYTLRRALTLREACRADVVKVKVAKSVCTSFTRRMVLDTEEYSRHIGVWAFASPAFHAIASATETCQATSHNLAQCSWCDNYVIRSLLVPDHAVQTVSSPQELTELREYLG